MLRPGFEPGSSARERAFETPVGVAKSLSKVPSLEYGAYKARFHEWLLGKHSERHAKDLIVYGDRHLPELIEDHFHLKQIYDEAKVGRRHLGLAIRNFLNFLEEFSIMDEDDLHKYRKVIKLDRTGTDDYVPETPEVLEAFEKFQLADYVLAFKLILYSGIRLIEAVEFLRTYDSNRLMEGELIAKYPLSMDRGTKKVLYVYIPASFAKELRRIPDLGLDATERYFVKRLAAKYLRKWQYNFLIENDVSESVVDFIQGRSLSQSVGGLHYLAKAKQADRFYARVVDKFPSFKIAALQ